MSGFLMKTFSFCVSVKKESISLHHYVCTTVVLWEGSLNVFLQILPHSSQWLLIFSENSKTFLSTSGWWFMICIIWRPSWQKLPEELSFLKHKQVIVMNIFKDQTITAVSATVNLVGMKKWRWNSLWRVCWTRSHTQVWSQKHFLFERRN